MPKTLIGVIHADLSPGLVVIHADSASVCTDYFDKIANGVVSVDGLSTLVIVDLDGFAHGVSDLDLQLTQAVRSLDDVRPTRSACAGCLIAIGYLEIIATRGIDTDQSSQFVVVVHVPVARLAGEIRFRYPDQTSLHVIARVGENVTPIESLLAGANFPLHLVQAGQFVRLPRKLDQVMEC